MSYGLKTAGLKTLATGTAARPRVPAEAKAGTGAERYGGGRQMFDAFRKLALGGYAEVENDPAAKRRAGRVMGDVARSADVASRDYSIRTGQGPGTAASAANRLLMKGAAGAEGARAYDDTLAAERAQRFGELGAAAEQEGNRTGLGIGEEASVRDYNLGRAGFLEDRHRYETGQRSADRAQMMEMMMRLAGDPTQAVPQRHPLGGYDFKNPYMERLRKLMGLG